nr:RHS repeat-associated core domain-containing protein [Serratia fonticola]
MHYDLHRYYSPEIARFITPDPIGLAGGLNQTQYVPNPTGWVDPLGLSSVKRGCPPDSDIPAGVKTGEPDIPQPMTSAQRHARINELAEANTYRRLQEMDAIAPNAHSLERHGAQTTLQTLLERVTTGANPTTGIIDTYKSGAKAGQAKIPSAATRYLIHRDQLNSIYRAKLILKRTGDKNLSKRPQHMGRDIVEGHKSETLEYGKQKSSVTILDDNGNSITSYPKWGQ